MPRYQELQQGIAFTILFQDFKKQVNEFNKVGGKFFKKEDEIISKWINTKHSSASPNNKTITHYQQEELEKQYDECNTLKVRFIQHILNVKEKELYKSLELDILARKPIIKAQQEYKNNKALLLSYKTKEKALDLLQELIKYNVALTDKIKNDPNNTYLSEFNIETKDCLKLIGLNIPLPMSKMIIKIIDDCVNNDENSDAVSTKNNEVDINAKSNQNANFSATKERNHVDEINTLLICAECITTLEDEIIAEKILDQWKYAWEYDLLHESYDDFAAKIKFLLYTLAVKKEHDIIKEAYKDHEEKDANFKLAKDIGLAFNNTPEKTILAKILEGSKYGSEQQEFKMPFIIQENYNKVLELIEEIKGTFHDMYPNSNGYTEYSDAAFQNVQWQGKLPEMLISNVWYKVKALDNILRVDNFPLFYDNTSELAESFKYEELNQIDKYIKECRQNLHLWEECQYINDALGNKTGYHRLNYHSNPVYKWNIPSIKDDEISDETKARIEVINEKIKSDVKDVHPEHQQGMIQKYEKEQLSANLDLFIENRELLENKLLELSKVCVNLRADIEKIKNPDEFIAVCKSKVENNKGIMGNSAKFTGIEKLMRENKRLEDLRYKVEEEIIKNEVGQKDLAKYKIFKESLTHNSYDHSDDNSYEIIGADADDF